MKANLCIELPDLGIECRFNVGFPNLHFQYSLAHLWPMLWMGVEHIEA